eukprot:Gb_16405 [translate_table: standard]
MWENHPSPPFFLGAFPFYLNGGFPGFRNGEKIGRSGQRRKGGPPSKLKYSSMTNSIQVLHEQVEESSNRPWRNEPMDVAKYRDDSWLGVKGQPRSNIVGFL